MKSLWKYITGFFSFVIGILVLSNKKNQKVKEIKGKIDNVKSKIKDVDSQLKDVKNKGDNIQKTLKSKKEALKEIKKQTFKKKDVSAKDASDFLKKYKKK